MSQCSHQQKENARTDNRAAFPVTAALVDEFREAFGHDQVTLVYAEENGKTIGKKPPAPVNFITLGQWLKRNQLIKDEQARRDITPLVLSGRTKKRGVR